MRFSKKTREEIKEEIEEETRQINGVYIKKELEKEYQRDIDFFQMVASIFESFENYQKGIANKERVESYDVYLDTLAKEAGYKSYPNYQKEKAHQTGCFHNTGNTRTISR